MTDLISRQAAIDAAVKMFEAWYGGSVLRNKEIRARFDALPSTHRKVLKYTGESICLHCRTVNCDGCMYEPMEGVQ